VGFTLEEEELVRQAIDTANKKIESCKKGGCNEENVPVHLMDASLELYRSIMNRTTIKKRRDYVAGTGTMSCGTISGTSRSQATIQVTPYGLLGNCCGGLAGTLLHEAIHLEEGPAEAIPNEVVNVCFGCN
jgi:hypothetical protein